MVYNLSTIMEFGAVTLRVLICDDEPPAAEDWLNTLRQLELGDMYQFLEAPSIEQIRSGIRVLLARRAALRANQTPPLDACLFDDADVLILDYDLLHVDENNTRYTGEGVARLARTFSRCGAMIVLNQYLEAQYDLSLKGHMESFADLNIDAALIATPGLWSNVADGGFRPWHWPVVSDLVTSLRRRSDWLLSDNNFSKSVSDTLGMTVDNSGRLSDTAFGFLAPTADAFEGLTEVTFEEFVRNNSAAVDTRDGAGLLDLDRPAAARLTASRLGKWIEREVLGPQDVLVDLPHLLQRAPYLLAQDVDDLNAWNAVAAGDNSKLIQIPKDAWMTATDWLTRPVLWWQCIESSEDVRKARASFDYSTAPDYVFAEDASVFVHIGEAKEFRAGFHNQYDRRYACNFENIRYAPQRRFAFGG